MAGEVASLFISRMAVPVLYLLANSKQPSVRNAEDEVGIGCETAVG
jgi:hypothetical protein